MLFDQDVIMRLGTAALALAVLAFSFWLPPLAVVWALAGLLVAQVVAELAGHEAHSGVGLDL
jgi:hypothetical protein